jgi:Fic family protein
VREKQSWEEWIIYMLDGIEQTAIKQTELINGIKTLMDETKEKLRAELPKIYSKDLLEILFMHPYTKINVIENSLQVTRKTASSYLNQLEDVGVLQEVKLGRNKFFVNKKLFELLQKGV